jgi:hypothetical protein
MVDSEDADPQPECDDPWISGKSGLQDSYGVTLSNVGPDVTVPSTLPQCGQPGQTLVCTNSGVNWATATYTKDPVDVGMNVKDQVCTIVARDLVMQSPEDGAECGGISLIDEMEKLNLRIDQIDEKHEMVLDRLDELLGLLKDLKKG